MDESDEAMSSAYHQQDEVERREDPQDNLPEDLSLNNKVHLADFLLLLWLIF